MIKIHQLTYNPFAENTYLLENVQKEVLIIDPGMYGPEECIQFKSYLDMNELKPVRVILTHAHLDHIFGLNWIKETYGLEPSLHEDDRSIYESAEQTAAAYGLQMDPLPMVTYDLVHEQNIDFGGRTIEILHTPGHSPGSVSFILKEEKAIIGGDVLFQGSIGRTDLPGGDYDTLIRSIMTQLVPLGDDYLVYSGHGPMTTIGQEKVSNFYLNQASF